MIEPVVRRFRKGEEPDSLEELIRKASGARELVERLAGKYVWWFTSGRETPDTRRVLAQVMELGTHEDVEGLRACAGDEVLRQVLRRAEPGWFSEKSWHYWHYVLDVATLGQVPDIPRRHFT